MKIQTLLTALGAALLFLTSATAARAQPGPGSGAGFLGEWSTPLGPMVIISRGNYAYGNYARNHGIFSGHTRRGVFEGHWRDRTGEGTLRLVLSPDGKTFTGEMVRTRGSGPPRTELSGTLVTPGEPEQPDGRFPVQTDRLTLQAAKRRVLPGGVVQVPVWLIHGRSLANMDWQLTYDPSVIRPEGEGQEGNLLDNRVGLFRIFSKRTGIIKSGFALNKGRSLHSSGSGTLAVVRFRAVGAKYSRSPLRLQVNEVYDQGGSRPAVACLDGLVLVVGPDSLIPGSSTGMPPARPTDPGQLGPGPGPRPPSPGPDNGLTALDALRALKMSVGEIPVDLNLDVDNSGTVTSRDAYLILQNPVAAAANRRRK